MILRIWHGWTKPEDATNCETLIRQEITQGIPARQLTGYRGAQLLRKRTATEVELVTMMWFDSLDAVHAFAGAEYDAAVIAPKVRPLLSRFDNTVEHYEVRADQKPWTRE
jgi:heme-degrading monooxygenase HmoA